MAAKEPTPGSVDAQYVAILTLLNELVDDMKIVKVKLAILSATPGSPPTPALAKPALAMRPPTPPEDAPTPPKAPAPPPDLKTLVLAFIERHGRTALVELLKTYGVTKASDVPADKSGKFLEDLLG